MAQLWGGRFTKETDQLVYNFNASISFDQKFYKQDIEGSIAHVCMLGKQGILTKEEMQQIVACLEEIRKDVEEGRLEITSEYEDIHSFVEANLIERLGDTGKKLHTGRSRNDQVALDMRLYTRLEVLYTDGLLKELLETILHIMEENTETIMPGFTHLQKAQPITLAHHMGAYFEMFKRDQLRLHDIYKRMNYCPLGSGALAGTTYPLDREYTAELMGFYGPTLNSMDGVSDRDYLIEFLSACATIMMHLSRFSEEVIIWNSNEYQFVEIDDILVITDVEKRPVRVEELRADLAVDVGAGESDPVLVPAGLGRGAVAVPLAWEEQDELAAALEGGLLVRSRHELSVAARDVDQLVLVEQPSLFDRKEVADRMVRRRVGGLRFDDLIAGRRDDDAPAVVLLVGEQILDVSGGFHRSERFGVGFRGKDR